MKTGFVTAKGKKVFDEFGKELMFRGVGLGGWMLPEGYMWGFHNYYTRPRRFEERILEVVGKEESDKFWNQYYQTFISERDFELIKDHGYNSVRLAINSRMIMVENNETSEVVFKESGFAMIDSVIEHCKTYGLYLIIDLHGAPGGQTGTNIDDSLDNKPRLYTETIFQDQTVTIWEEIARRYKDEQIVAMYDLLNEPLPDWNKHLFDKIQPLYKRIIKAIRKIDQDHMISLEGGHWSTNFHMITERLDDNLILHFHKYWNQPALETMNHFLNKREELDYPLFMGEGGENDLYWYSSSFKMYEQLDISWNFWTYKKIENNNSIISFKRPENWHKMFSEKEVPTKEEGIQLLNKFLENIKFENCTVNIEVTNALFRQDDFMLPSSFYDYYGQGISFKTKNDTPSNLRILDNVKMVDKDGEKYEHKFSRLKKEEKLEEKYPYIYMFEGDYYNYTFYLTIGENKEFVITHNKGVEYNVFINDTIIKGTVNDEQGVYHFNSTKRKNILRIECVKEGIIRQIRLK